MNFSVQNFVSFEPEFKIAIYQEANETQNIDVVRQLNDLGMKPSVPDISGPTIISSFMDLATKYDIILGFLKELRQRNRLLTEEEFQPLATKKWYEKHDLNRVLGYEHILRKIEEMRSKHIKIPFYVAVIKGNEEFLKMQGWGIYSDNFYKINSYQITLYSEEIEPVERHFSRDEIDEFIDIVAATNFTDLWPANFILAKQGVYFIDTEFKSFEHTIDWGKMARFDSLIKEEDKDYFNEKISKKFNESKEEEAKENHSYSNLQGTLERFKKLPESKLKQVDKQDIEEMENKISRLEYVGARATGSSHFKPDNFSFILTSILQNTN